MRLRWSLKWSSHVQNGHCNSDNHNIKCPQLKNTKMSEVTSIEEVASIGEEASKSNDNCNVCQAWGE